MGNNVLSQAKPQPSNLNNEVDVQHDNVMLESNSLDSQSLGSLNLQPHSAVGLNDASERSVSTTVDLSASNDSIQEVIFFLNF